MDYDAQLESILGDNERAPPDPRGDGRMPSFPSRMPGSMARARPNAAERAYEASGAAEKRHADRKNTLGARLARGGAPSDIAGTSKLLAYAPPGQGPGQKRAGKPFGESELAHVLARIDALSRVPESDRVKVLLTYRAGLRPCEVAGLQRRTLFTATGELKEVLEVTGNTAKRGKPRTLPMHPQLRGALVELFENYPEAERVAFSRVSAKGFKYQTADALYLWYPALFLGAGLHGCTGMSGRRSFATGLACFAPPSLVQQALGHASLRMIEYYVRPVGNLEAAIQQLGSDA